MTNPFAPKRAASRRSAVSKPVAAPEPRAIPEKPPTVSSAPARGKAARKLRGLEGGKQRGGESIRAFEVVPDDSEGDDE